MFFYVKSDGFLVPFGAKSPGDLKELLVAQHGLSFPRGSKILGKRPGIVTMLCQLEMIAGLGDEFSQPEKANDE